jgi:hypothetical protein
VEEAETASLLEPTGSWTRLFSSRLQQKIKRTSGEDIILFVQRIGNNVEMGAYSHFYTEKKGYRFSRPQRGCH